MRVEDIDGPRVKKGAEAAALDELSWMGLDWDGDPFRQSDRLPLYREACEALIRAGLAYPCICTRKEVEEAASAPHEESDQGPVYPGTCRDRFSSPEEAEEATGRAPALRFKVDRQSIPFHDGFLGPQRGQIRGDFVIAKRDGGPAYQLAVVVDDAAMRIDEVLRADDLLSSTPRQLLLYEALGLTPPSFLHVPLVVGPDGKRLAKRHGDTSLARFMREGVKPDVLVGYLAGLAGLVPPGTACMPRDLVEGFSLDRVSRDKVLGTHRLS